MNAALPTKHSNGSEVPSQELAQGCSGLSRTPAGMTGGSVSDPPPLSARFLSRDTVLWLCVLAALLNLFALASQTIFPWNGNNGFATAATATPFVVRVTSVYGPALTAGVRVGDLIDIRRDNYTRQLPIPGKPLHFTVLRDAGSTPV